ncbi:MAG: DUF1326 domain-containing protein [Acidobacteriota bacterium]
MRNIVLSLLTAALLLPAATLASPSASLQGVYVEARSAQVFIGGCIKSSEAQTMGREAVLSWHVDRGTVDDVRVDGLSVVAVVAGDQNLALYPEASRRTILYVDERANAAQRDALADLVATRHAGVLGDVTDVVAAPVGFERGESGYSIRVADEVRVDAEAMPPRHQDLVSCGEQAWYEPFVQLDEAVTAVARQHSYQGDALGIRWSDPHGQSAYYGAFRLD